MMKCGHASNSVLSRVAGKEVDPPIPACVICDCFEPAAIVPDLTGRIALCVYRGCKAEQARRRDTHYGEFGKDGRSFAPSSVNLPFFEHRPDKPNDIYFCGCMGWD
jgi:hypothetical protein